MKGLEALKTIRNTKLFIDFELDTTIGKEVGNELDIIEEELKELNDIKTGKIRLSVEHSENYVAMPKYQYEQDIKKLKALEIIKKHIKIYGERLTPFGKVEIEHIYLKMEKDVDDKNDDFDLLKEVLL